MNGRPGGQDGPRIARPRFRKRRETTTGCMLSQGQACVDELQRCGWGCPAAGMLLRCAEPLHR